MFEQPKNACLQTDTDLAIVPSDLTGLFCTKRIERHRLGKELGHGEEAVFRFGSAPLFARSSTPEH